MAKSFLFSLFIATGLLFSANASSQSKGYKIEVTVNGIHDTTAILAHYLGKSMYPDDTATLDKKGHGVFKKAKKLQQGLYILYLPNGSYFEVIIGADQHFSLKTDTTDYLKNLIVEGSPDNSIFVDFQRYMIDKRTEMTELQKAHKEAKSEKEKEKIINKIEKLNEERKEKVNKIIDENPDLFVSTFLKATAGEVEVPDDIKDDKKKGYAYYKAHYFDNFDISDVRLLHTPLYEDKILHYLDKVVVQIPDTLIKEIDYIIDKAKSDSALFRYVLITLFNKYGKSNIMGMDAVQVHIADKYYITEAWWSSEEFITDLKKRVKVLKPLLIGKVSPNPQLRYVPSEHFKEAKNDTALKRYPHAGSFFNIHDVDADFTVLLFWEATCSHCKKVFPKVYSLYQDSLKAMNVEVIAISTLFGEDGKEKWIDFVNQKQAYDWINAWNPYDYKYKEIFDVRSTPQIFVLNKDKEIIGKKLGPENIAELINAYKKHNNK